MCVDESPLRANALFFGCWGGQKGGYYNTPDTEGCRVPSGLERGMACATSLTTAPFLRSFPALCATLSRRGEVQPVEPVPAAGEPVPNLQIRETVERSYPASFLRGYPAVANHKLS